ncbi:putative ATPase [Agrobacterium sp. DSM 25558]|nr:putative ATPase [Agrobacterium sp. DSM 25558]
MAYGGWDDIFTSSLESLVGNANDFPEIIWTFYNALPSIDERLKRILSPGIDRGRVNLYSSIDCHRLLPKIAAFWQSDLELHSESTIETTKINAPKSPLRFDTRSLECDRPPSVDIWVGREPELRALETTDAKIAIICGFGGQGKSHLAAKYLEAVTKGETPYSDWDWRDCKEEGDRIRTQIVAAIERVADELTVDLEMDSMTDRDLVNSFISVLHKTSRVFVFDNVDHYVDLEKEEFFGILDVLVRQFSKSNSPSKIIFTCRPQVNYDISEVSSFTLLGISLAETVELFTARCEKNKVVAHDIQIAHEVTAGHPIWLDMMAVRVARVPGMTLSKINDDIRRDRSKNPDILSSLWKTLADREQTVLRVMSEAKRAETMEMIEKFTGSQLNYNKFSKAMRSLIALNLVIVKAQKNAPDLYDLHPLVRAFVRKSFNRPERKTFIQIVINEYNVLIRGIESMLGVHLPFPLLERWSQKAELEIEAGLFEDAFATLNKADDALIGGGHSEEFIRVAGKLFEAVDWLHASAEFKNFDDVIASTLFCLEQLQRRDDADSMLERYKLTMATKSARYIKYLDILAHKYWTRGEYQNAIDTAQEGVNLKDQTGVDTTHDCSQALALAQRDGGAPEEALPFFLKTHELDHLLTKEGILTVDEPTTIGNIGRCLQMMGRNDDAIICFQRSAQLLQDNVSTHRLSNLAYAYHWLAQALTTTGDEQSGYCFFVEAEELAAKFSPGRLLSISQDKDKFFPADKIPSISNREIRRQVKTWLGKEL